MSVDILELIKREKWELKRDKGIYTVKVYEHEFPVTHPVQIHLKLYRVETNPDTKFLHMKAAHDYLWPKALWHYWTEDRFREHCNGWNYIGWAGGASAAKSFDAATIATLFWFANPKKRGVVVASTTLESLSARVWGYVTDAISNMAVKLPFQHLGGQAPKILYPNTSDDEIRSSRHGMYAVAAKTGDADKAIANTIGRHPDEALMVVLDEAPDLNIAIAKGFPNLDSTEKPFQVIAIGNSNSTSDLHGAICTPKDGWPSVDPLVDTKWLTTQKNGICMFFSCYNSPAIHEADPVRKKKLSKFLVTKEVVDEKEVSLGKESDSFYRFVLGYWKSSTTDLKVMSKQFLDGYDIQTRAEWLGVRPLYRVAGLDPAFSTGGDKCILRIGIMGQTTDGGVVLDFRNQDLLFEIKIKSSHGRSGKSAELQIAEQVCDKLIEHGVALEDLAIDSNGQGRALGGTIYLEMAKRRGQLREPLKIYSTRGANIVNSFGMVVKTSLDLWNDVRKYLERNQIKGIDPIAEAQFSHRRIIQDEKTLKQRLETKKEFKTRMVAVNPALAHSPDEADSICIALQSAVHNYGFSLGQRMDLPKIEGFAHEKLLAHMANIERGKMVQEGGTSGQLPLPNFSTSVEDFAAKRSAF